MQCSELRSCQVERERDAFKEEFKQESEEEAAGDVTPRVQLPEVPAEPNIEVMLDLNKSAAQGGHFLEPSWIWEKTSTTDILITYSNWVPPLL